ncbi:MAG: hypothetical protein OXM56_06580 [Gammaproteobacteria bacterium]|nr:hypothetical protein [Gammaproteobacteria bacterium]
MIALDTNSCGCSAGSTERHANASVLLELLATEGVVLEKAQDVADAALGYAARRQGAPPPYTFDRRAASVDGVELLPLETP